MTPDLLYSDTEDALRESVRGLLAANCPSERVTAAYDGDDSLGTELWATVTAAMDLPGIGVAESSGGAGASPREVAVVMEELGRSVAPIPFLTSSVIAARVLAVCGADDLLTPLAEGTSVVALAVPWGDLDGLELPTLTGDRVSGLAPAVAGADHADLLLVPAQDGSTLVVVAVAAADADIAVRSSLDMTRPIADITLTDAPARVLARGPEAEAALRSGLLHGGAMLASEQLGIAEWCLESTLAYVRQRHQFGRPIGSFQALKHRLARLWIAVNSARAAARNAAVLLDEGGTDAAVAMSLARSFCSDVAVQAAEECVQMHGGIGMTWEHPAHLYLKRAKADQISLGTPAHHRAVLADAHQL